MTANDGFPFREESDVKIFSNLLAKISFEPDHGDVVQHIKSAASNSMLRLIRVINLVLN